MKESHAVPVLDAKNTAAFWIHRLAQVPKQRQTQDCLLRANTGSMICESSFPRIPIHDCTMLILILYLGS